jgi:hypothetical protein
MIVIDWLSGQSFEDIDILLTGEAQGDPRVAALDESTVAVGRNESGSEKSKVVRSSAQQFACVDVDRRTELERSVAQFTGEQFDSVINRHGET